VLNGGRKQKVTELPADARSRVEFFRRQAYAARMMALGATNDLDRGAYVNLAVEWLKLAAAVEDFWLSQGSQG